MTNSNNNRVRRSEFAGNGTIALGPPPAAIPNDFGVGLVGSSIGNVIEENLIGGNINGLALFPLGPATPAGNLIRKNVIVGNPPMEISADNPGLNPVGADIRDFSAPGSNTFEDYLCITYTGATSPAPCPGRHHDLAVCLDDHGVARAVGADVRDDLPVAGEGLVEVAGGANRERYEDERGRERCETEGPPKGGHLLGNRA